MIEEIKDFDIKELFIKRKEIASALASMPATSKYKYQDILPTTKYVTYTNLKSVYNFIDSDSLYVFCSELSNDYSENKMINVDMPYDTYIASFYQGDEKSGDVYSQWLAYCSGGGASFEFYFGQDTLCLQNELSKDEYKNFVAEQFKCMNNAQKNMFNFSLLCNDAKQSSDFYLYPNYPILVQYCDANNQVNQSFYSRVISKVMNQNKNLILPYFKHSGFFQENEARLAFINKDHRLDRCIKFMEKPDNTKIPYIEVKFGDIDKDNRPCKFVDSNSKDIEKVIKEMLDNRSLHKRNNSFPIVIPQGNNQEMIYNIVEKILNSDDYKKYNYKIICQGHLPITKITLAPMKDSALQKKKLQIYCRSKYWLRNVEICESSIPYNTMNNNH